MRAARRAPVACALALSLAYAMPGCVTPGATPGADPGAAAVADSARGIVRRVGAEPTAALVLEPPPGGDGALLSLGGPAGPLLPSVVGLEIVVRGRAGADLDMTAGPRGARSFEVASFLVRAADGVSAHDGVLVSRDGATLLRTAEGELLIGALPAALRTLVGARVFLAGPLDRPPVAYGVIEERGR